MAELIWLPLGGDLSQGFAPVTDRAAVNLVYFVGLGTVPRLGADKARLDVVLFGVVGTMVVVSVV